MVTIGVGQLRGDTVRYVERAAVGESFEVLRRGRPIARLQAAQDHHHLLIPVPLNDLRIRAGQFVDRVAAGETIAVEYRGRTVATLQPCRSRAAGNGVTRPRRLPAAMRQTAVS